MLEILASNLLMIRKTRHITQKEVAETIGITATALSAYEKAQREPSLGVVMKLADFYGVSLDWLCGHKTKNDRSEMSRADFLRSLSEAYEALRCGRSDLMAKCTLDVKKLSAKEAAMLSYKYEKYYNESHDADMAPVVTFEFSSLNGWMWSYFQALTDLLNVRESNRIEIDIVTPWKNAELSKYESIPLFNGEIEDEIKEVEE